MPCRATWGSTRNGQEVEGRGHIMAQNLKERARQGRVCRVSLALDSLKNVGGPWAIRLGPSCLVRVPGMMQERGNIGWVCESLLKEIGVWTLE